MLRSVFQAWSIPARVASSKLSNDVAEISLIGAAVMLPL
jgi:hypothetical protein